jgi:MFS family permease
MPKGGSSTERPSTEPRRAGQERESLWRNGDFLKLWGGETISQVGSQISVLALPLTAIIPLHATAEQVGLLTAAQFAPVFVITLFAGVWLDTHRRRPALIVANLGRAVLLGMVPLLFAFDLLTMTVLYSVAFLAGLLTALFDVAYVVYLPSLVPPARLTEANAKLEATYSISQIGGPGLGGLLVQTLTAPFALLADAVSYLLATVGVASIRHPEPSREPPTDRTSTWAGIREGLATTLRHPLLRPLVSQSAWFNLFEQAILTLYLLYGVRNLQLSPGLLGLILAMGSLGALAGTLVAGWAGRTFGVGRTLVTSMILCSAALALVPAASGAKLTAASVLFVGLLLYGLGLSVFNVHNLTLRARIVPGHLFARVTATYRFISFSAIPLGGLLGGYLGEAFGVRTAMTFAVVALVAGSVVFAFSRVRSVAERDVRSGS